MKPAKAADAEWTAMKAFGRTAAFTGLRIDPKTLPDGLDAYCVRSSDDGFRWATLERHVTVNFEGTLCFAGKAPEKVLKAVAEQGYYPLTAYDRRTADFCGLDGCPEAAEAFKGLKVC